MSTLFESFLLFSTKVLSIFLVAFLLPLSPTIPANFRKHVACSQPLMSRKRKIPIKRITWSHQTVAVGFHFQQLWNFAENNWMNNLRYTSRCTYICQNCIYVYRKIFCESENVQKESVQHFTCYKEGKHRYKDTIWNIYNFSKKFQNYETALELFSIIKRIKLWFSLWCWNVSIPFAAATTIDCVFLFTMYISCGWKDCGSWVGFFSDIK